MPRRLALVLFVAIAPALHAQEANELRDDARGRQQARLQMEGLRTLETQQHVLDEAAREATKWGVGKPRLHSAAAVQGETWINVGPAFGSQNSPLQQTATDSGRMRRIVPHPTEPGILYVATAGGGVWKTFDAQNAITSSPTTGPHWTSITGGIGSQSVGALAIDPNSPDTLYLGLGDPFDVQTPGFYISLNGGISWTATEPLGSTSSVRDIVVDPSGTGAVLAATDAGIFRRMENSPWTNVAPGGYSNCWSVVWVGPQRWLASCEGAVFLSTDNGVGFQSSRSGIDASAARMTLAAARSDSASPSSAWVYLLAGNGGDQQDVYLSKNGGATWGSLGMNSSGFCDPVHGGPCRQPINWTQDQPDLDVLHDQAWYNQAIIVDPRDHNKVFIGGNLAMMRSDDAGANWRVLTDWLPGSPLCALCSTLPYVHADWHTMAVSVSPRPLPAYCGVTPIGAATTVPAGTPCFYAGTDGGVFRSTDAFAANPLADNSSAAAAPHFEGRLGRGLVTHLAYSIATDLHDSSSTVMIGGLQDNGTRMRRLGTGVPATTFNQVIGADGFAVGIGISNSSAAGVSCKGKWGSLLVGTIYGVIYRSVDCGNSFAPAMAGICKPDLQIFNPGGGCNVNYGSNFFMKLASDQADASGQTFLTVINDSACDPAQKACTTAYGTNSVYVTHNGESPSLAWVKTNGNIGNFPSELRSVSTNPKAAGQWAVTDRNYAYVTGDSGANWVKSAVLPGTVDGVAFEVAGVTKLWASSKGGKHVYRSADGGASWVDKSGDLPDVPANTVAVDPNDPSTVYLGTEIGLYRTQNGGQNWIRYGGSTLPMVSVTEINVSLDSKAIRISTFGRGFWELTQSATTPSGVYGNGDFDKNQLIDGFDLVHEAAVLGTSAATDGFDPVGNLLGDTNAIDGADFNALVVKMGGRP